jgi:pimeloyl-ACP methyl ester carboxylesterase
MRLDMRIHQSRDTKPPAWTDNVVALPADRPKPFLFLAIAMSALLLLATAPLTAARGGALEGAAAPTIVLVHGAWADETGWNDVVARLQKDGYRTAAPRLGVIDPSADIATVRATLDAIAGPKILVGHSYGGYVVTNAASGRTDVQALVYTAAFTPDEGDTLQSLGVGYAPPAAFEHFIWTGEPFASLAYIDPVWFRHDFAQDLNPKAAAQMSDHQQPIALPILITPSGPAAWHTVPSWFAISGADRMIDPALQRAEASRIGATTVVFDDASHAGGFTHYAARFTTLIEDAAAATTH